MDPTLARALRYISQVQAVIAGKTYEEFRHTLTQYGRKEVDISFVISTVEELFREQYPQLLDGFKDFVPSDCAAEFAAEDHRKRSSVDFLNRVKARLGGRAYLRLLERMHAYARKEIGDADLVDEVVGLFRGNDDLVAEFASFLPESCAGEGSRKRKRADRGGGEGDSELRRRGTKDRVSDSDSPTARRTARRLMTGEQKEAKRVADRDNAMEDALCAVEVRVSNLETTIERAMRLSDRLSRGRLSPADVRLDEHFTPLNLACIRSFHEKFLEDADVDLVRALPELMEVLKRKKKASERERVKIAQRWRLLRNSDF